MDGINETMKQNQLLARKFYRIEKALAGIPSPHDLFEQLLIQIGREFSVPYVWLSLVQKGTLADSIESLEPAGYLKDRINIIDETTLLDLLGNSASPILADKDLQPFYKLLPPNVKYFIKSIAVAPLTTDGTIAGSLNLGDHSPERYRPGMDTDLLKRLVNAVSCSLSAMLPRHAGEPAPPGNKAEENERV